MTTPEQEHEQRVRGHALMLLTERWGEWYLIGFDTAEGVFVATHRTTPGKVLTSTSAAQLDRDIADDYAERRVAQVRDIV